MATSTAAPPQTAIETTPRRWRGWRWPLLTLIVLAAVAAISTYLTAPRPGFPMDPESTQPDGAHALVTLLRDNGVEVVVADRIADVEKAARPDTLTLVAESEFLTDNTLLDRLARRPRRPAPGGTHGTNPRGAGARAGQGDHQYSRQQPQLHSARS